MKFLSCLFVSFFLVTTAALAKPTVKINLRSGTETHCPTAYVEVKINSTLDLEDGAASVFHYYLITPDALALNLAKIEKKGAPLDIYRAKKDKTGDLILSLGQKTSSEVRQTLPELIRTYKVRAINSTKEQLALELANKSQSVDADLYLVTQTVQYEEKQSAEFKLLGYFNDYKITDKAFLQSCYSDLMNDLALVLPIGELDRASDTKSGSRRAKFIFAVF